MAFKDKFKEIFCPYDPETEKLLYAGGTVLSGGLGGTCSLLLVYPLDYARTRLSVDTEKEFDGLSGCLKKSF